MRSSRPGAPSSVCSACKHRVRVAARGDAKARQRPARSRSESRRPAESSRESCGRRTEDRAREDSPSRAAAFSRIVSPFAPTVTTLSPRARAAAITRGAMALSASMTAGAPSRQKVPEQPELGGEIILDRRVIVHVVARQVGERARGEPHAVEPLLVEAMRGGLDREIGDAASRRADRAAHAARSGPASSAIHRRSAGATRRRSFRSKPPRVRAPARSGARRRRPRFFRWSRSPRRSSRAGADRSARRHARARRGRRRP